MHHHLYLIAEGSHQFATLPGYQLGNRIWHRRIFLKKMKVAAVQTGEQEITAQEYKNETNDESIFPEESEQS